MVCLDPYRALEIMNAMPIKIILTMHIYNTFYYLLVYDIYLAIHLHAQCFILFLRHVMAVLPRDALWLVPSRAASPVSGRSQV